MDTSFHAKTCTQCHVLKPLIEFYNEPKSPDGKAWYCKVCTKANNAARAAKPKIIVAEKLCRKCHIVKSIDQFGIDQITRDGYASRCLLCKCSESEDYRDKEPEKVRAAVAKWRAENPDKLAIYQEAHREEKNTQRRARYAANPAKENTQTSAFYFANKDKLRPKRRAWDQAHPEFTHAKAKRRRAQTAGSTINDFTHAQWLEIQESQKHRCYYCGKRYKGKLTQDHLTPLSKGGAHTLANIIAACNSCNSRKRTGPPPVPVQPLLLTIAPSKP